MLATTGCGVDVTALSPVDAAAPVSKSYSVTAFGAKGDGIADDGPAIQRALNAAAATGGTLNFPCGEFALRSAAGTAPQGRSLLYLKGVNGLQVVGAGSCTHLFTAMAQKTVLELESSSQVSVTKMRITALNTAYIETYGMDGGSAVRFTSVSYGIISNVEVDGATAGALYFTAGTSYSNMNHNNIHDTYGSGIWEDDCGAASSTTCAPSLPPSNNVYDSNTLTNTSLEMPTAMTTDDGSASSHAVLSNNVISWTRSPVPGTTRVFCIQIGNTADVTVLNNTCTGPAYDGIVVTTGNGQKSQRITIQGNTIQSVGSPQTGGSGIVAYDDPTGGGISNLNILYNNISNTETDGISLVSAAKAGSVHDCQVTNNTISMVDQLNPGTRYGVDVERSASIAVSSNNISCNGHCIAVGVNVVTSPATVPTAASNQVANISGVPLLIR